MFRPPSFFENVHRGSAWKKHYCLGFRDLKKSKKHRSGVLSDRNFRRRSSFVCDGSDRFTYGKSIVFYVSIGECRAGISPDRSSGRAGTSAVRKNVVTKSRIRNAPRRSSARRSVGATPYRVFHSGSGTHRFETVHARAPNGIRTVREAFAR